MSCYANASSALPRKDGGVSVLGVGGLRGKGDASQVEPLAPFRKKGLGFFLVSLRFHCKAFCMQDYGLFWLMLHAVIVLTLQPPADLLFGQNAFQIIHNNFTA